MNKNDNNTSSIHGRVTIFRDLKKCFSDYILQSSSITILLIVRSAQNIVPLKFV